MARLSTPDEAKRIAAEANNWLAAIRNAPNIATLNRSAAEIMARADRMGVCHQIKQHLVGAIAEERQRHGDRQPEPAVRGKSFAAGDA